MDNSSYGYHCTNISQLWHYKKSATNTDVTTTPTTTTENVEANTNFISIAEAIDMVEHPEKIANIMKNTTTN